MGVRSSCWWRLHGKSPLTQLLCSATRWAMFIFSQNKLSSPRQQFHNQVNKYRPLAPRPCPSLNWGPRGTYYGARCMSRAFSGTFGHDLVIVIETVTSVWRKVTKVHSTWLIRITNPCSAKWLLPRRSGGRSPGFIQHGSFESPILSQPNDSWKVPQVLRPLSSHWGKLFSHKHFHQGVKFLT